MANRCRIFMVCVLLRYKDESGVDTGLAVLAGGGAQCWEFSLSLDVRREVRVLSTLQGYRSTA